MNNNDGNGDLDIDLNSGNYNENIGRDYNDNRKIINNPPPEKPFKPIKYIPKFGSKNFVGRQDDLITVHQELYEGQNNRVAISAVSGMGGVGKTELAIQYANKHNDDYSGGICWLNVRGGNLATEIIQFIQLEMGLEVPQKDLQENALTVEEQVAWCWQNWRPPEGLVLVILDDVTEYRDIKKLLPRTNNQRFKLLITTRQRRLDSNFVDLPLDVLSEDESLSLLRGILGEEDGRIDRELQIAKDLCQWLGYLPLGLELVGRYLLEDPDLSVAEILEELNEERLDQEAINPESEDLEATEMTAKLGVQAAFNLTWKRLDLKTKEVGELLSLFEPTVIAWKYVDSVSESLNWIKKDVKNAKKQLYKRHLIERLGEEEASYKIHPLIREFLQTKINDSEHKRDYTQSFCAKFIEIGRTIPEATTLEFINSVKNAIPHLTEVAENHLDAVSDENLIWAFIGLARFYNGQGLYTLAEPWFQQYVEVVKSHFGENHRNYAESLNNLALLYKSQEKYEEAELLYTQAKELCKRILGENHPHTATSLNNLAGLYYSQGKYEEAEPLLIQALELRKRILGEDHPDYAQSLNNLALLYNAQGKYEEAEPLLIQALELIKCILGEDHPHYATSLNNLALLYSNQGKYEKAKPLYIQALELTKRILGEDHPDYARSLHNLASLYSNQGRYDQAEPLFIQALEIAEQVLGSDHPKTEMIRLITENFILLRKSNNY
ncbi:NB-ARC domain protein [Hyella patelloides LEGE 07179]|uniref:NB-ARC domain protein n=2 Tax=Hyella TaxID=945733 RepID=A0A563VT37_9CYAN|nr:NB-ARC domain protein [Hyella patelloides LEGE 07179]